MQSAMEDMFNKIEKKLIDLDDKQRDVKSNFNEQIGKIINTLNFTIPKQRQKIQMLKQEMDKGSEYFKM